MSFDSRCADLALTFLDDDERFKQSDATTRDAMLRELAQTIQRAVEGWLAGSFYEPGYQYEVAVAGATDLLTSKINALPLLLAVAKAAARSTATPDAPGAQAAIDAAVVALYDQHPGWREWAP